MTIVLMVMAIIIIKKLQIKTISPNDVDNKNYGRQDSSTNGDINHDRDYTGNC